MWRTPVASDEGLWEPGVAADGVAAAEGEGGSGSLGGGGQELGLRRQESGGAVGVELGWWEPGRCAGVVRPLSG